MDVDSKTKTQADCVLARRSRFRFTAGLAATWQLGVLVRILAILVGTVTFVAAVAQILSWT